MKKYILIFQLLSLVNLVYANSIKHSIQGIVLNQENTVICTPPKLVITNPQTVCAPQSVDLTAASVTAGSTAGVTPTYWMDAAATIALNNPGNVIVSGIYYIKLGTDVNCHDIQPVKVTVNQQPKLVITSPSAVCEAATVDISAGYITAGSDPGLSLSYWTDASATSQLSNYTAISSGGTYYIKADNGTQCPSIMPVTVVINQKTTPQFSLTNLLCQNSTPPVLPTTSNNNINGTWSPSTVSTSVLGASTYVFTPGAGQCAKPTTLDITITDEIKPVFAAIGPLCLGSSAPLLSTKSENGIVGTWSPTLISTSVLGITDYIFTTDAGQCANPITRSVTITDPVTPTFAPIAPVCQNSFINPLPTTSIEGISGIWSPAFSSATAGTKTYTFTPNAGVCANTTTATITVNPLVPVTFDLIGPFCAGASAPTLPSTSKEGISGTWSPAVVDMTQTRTYAFTPNAGCTNPFSMTIVINRLDVSVSVTPISSLNPRRGINLTVSGGSGPYSYSWTGPNGFTSTSQNLSGLNAGEYNVEVTELVTLCKASATTTMYRLDELAIRLEATEITCPGGSDGTATAYISYGTPPYSIQWKNSPAPVAINSSIVTITGLSKDDYFYATVIDATGKRVSSSFVAIKESSIRSTIASTISTAPACFGENGTIQLTFGSGGIVPFGYYTVFYDGGQFDAIEISGNRATISAPSGTYNNIYVEVRGCPTNAVSTVIGPAPPPLPLPTVVVIQPDCDILVGTIEFVTPAPAAGITYTLKGTNPVVFAKTNTTGLFAGLAAGIYDLTYTNAMDCTSGYLSVTLIALAPTSKGNLSACESSPLVTLDARNSIDATGKNLVWYDALVGGNVVTTPTLNAIKTVTYYVENVNGVCASSPRTSVTLTIYPLPVKPTAIVSVVPRCIDTSGVIEVKSPLGPNYMYSIDNGAYQSSVTFSNQIPGNHSIRVKNTITTCESGVTVIKVSEIPPVPKIIGLTVENCICYGDLGKLNFEFENVVDGTSVIFYEGGQFNNIKVVNGKASIMAPAGIYNILAIEANGCTSSENWNVEIKQPNQISVSATITEIDLISKQKGEINLTITGGTGPYQTIWQPNPFNGFVGASTEDIKNLDAGEYVVIVTASNGCVSTKIFSIPKTNMPPIATDDEFTAGSTGFIGNLLYPDNGNGIDSDPDGDPFTIDTTPVLLPSHGTLTINKDGTFEYKAIQGYVGDDSFRYVIYDVKNNFSNPATVTIHNVINVGTVSLESPEINIYPNPTKGIIRIEGLSTQQTNKITILTPEGKLVRKIDINSESLIIDISNETQGIYLLICNNKSYKIIKY